MTDDFETRVAGWLHDRARPDPTALAAVVASIDSLPARRVTRRRGWLLAAAAVVAIVAVGSTSLLVATRPSSSPIGSSQPVPPDPAAFAGDPRLAACLGTADPVEFAFEMTHARDYQLHLPAMLLSPELDVDDAAFVVVFAAGAQLPVGGGGPPSSPGANERTVCILVGDTPNVYGNVDISGMQAVVPTEPRPSSPAPTLSPDPGLASPSPQPSTSLPFFPIRRLVLDADGRHIHLEFFGSREFVPGEPCSSDYEAVTEVLDGTLEIGVRPVAAVPSEPSPTSVGCADIGFARTLEVVLDEPFVGTRWHDLAGFRHFLAPPADLVELTGLSPDWVLQNGRDLEGSPGGGWERTYSRTASSADPTDDIVLYQSFDGSPPVGGGTGQFTWVQVDGRDAKLFQDPASGEFVLVWQLGTYGLGLVAFEQQVSRDELIALAESAPAPMVWLDASGAAAPPETIQSFPGPGHCGWDSTTWLRHDGVLFIRDPMHVLADETVIGFEADGGLPEDAVDTGLHTGEWRLHTVSAGDAVYPVTRDRNVERWGRAKDPMMGCA